MALPSNPNLCAEFDRLNGFMTASEALPSPRYLRLPPKYMPAVLPGAELSPAKPFVPYPPGG